MWTIFVHRDASLQSKRPTDSELTISAALFIDSLLDSPRFRELFRDARHRQIRWFGGAGGAGGFIDLLSTGIWWRPGRLSAYWKLSSFEVLFSEIESAKVEPVYPALGRLAAMLHLNLKDGTRMEFWTRDAKRVKAAFEEALEPER